MLVTRRSHGIVLRSFHHPNAQDAKGGIDACFGTKKRHLYGLVNKGCGVATPRQLFNCLSAWPKKTVHIPSNRDAIDKLLEHYTLRVSTRPGLNCFPACAASTLC
jgi:hypothetical protein